MPFSGLKTEHRVLKNIFPHKWPRLNQLKHLPNFLNKREKRIVTICGLVFLFSILLLLFRLPHAVLEIAPSYGGQYIEGTVGAPQYINPVLAKSNEADLDLSKLIFSGLFKYNERLEIVPDLAKTIDISSDKLTYKIQLKDKAVWHDGQPITTDDIVFTIATLKNPELKSSWSAIAQTIQIIPQDKNNIVFVLSKPMSGFLNFLTVGLLPKHIWQNIPIKQFTLSGYNLKPIGSGPWQFKKLTRNAQGEIRSYILERNQKFYDPGPYLSKITFQFYKDFDELAKAAQKRQISGISYAPAHIEQQLISGGVLKKYSLPLPHYTAIFFNIQNNKALNSKIVRQALSYAVPRDKIIDEVLFGEGQVLQGPLLPPNPYYAPDLVQYNYDPAKTNKLLASTGWKMGDDGFWHQGDQTLEITLTTVQQSDLEQIGQIIQSSWQDLGIKTKLLSVPPDMMQSEIITPHNYQALIFGIVQKFDADPYPLWHSSQTKSPGLNLALYDNTRVDDLLAKAQTTPFDDVKKKKYIEFQQIINDELPAIFLYTDSYTYLVDKNIKGINVEKINAPSDRLNGINNWYISTKNVPKKSAPATKK